MHCLSRSCRKFIAVWYNAFMLEDFPNDENKKSLIERLEEKLYSRTGKIRHKERTKLRPKKSTLTEDWGEEGLRFEQREKPHHFSLYAAIFISSITFFIVAGTVAGFIFLSKKQPVSPDNVNISVFGPVSINGGEVFSFQVLIENKNTAPLKNVGLTVEFPPGTRYVNQPSQALERFYKTIGTIAPGEVRSETVNAVLLGGEKIVKDIGITTNFQIEGSDAKFAKNKSYPIALTVPALFTKAELVKEVTSGQDVTLSTDVVSNAPSLLKGGLLQVDYPAGFVFKKATPAPSFGNNAWKLGDFELGDSRHIEIQGTVFGEESQEKVFRIYTGVTKNDKGSVFDVIFSSFFQSLVVKKPFFDVWVTIDRGDATISFINNLPDKIITGEINASIIGADVDRTMIQPMGGFYRSPSDETMVWDQRTIKGLGLILPGAKNEVSFSFGLLPFVFGGNVMFKNPEIEVVVNIKGKRISENNVPEEIKFSVTKKFKLPTDIQFAARSVYHVGPFSNTGPLPPAFGKETTYTVIWSIKNTINDVSGAVVKTVLPPSVEWKGLVSPPGTKITYNTVTHQIVWNIGTIKAGAGYDSDPQEVAFQVVLLPTSLQIGSIQNLISDTVFSGKDDFTSNDITKSIPPVSTMLSTDPSFDEKEAKIVP